MTGNQKRAGGTVPERKRPLLKIKHVTKYYGSETNLTKALDDVSLEACEGEFIGVMGASGSGKTTLLQCVSTLDVVTGGSIYLEGKDITGLTEKETAAFRSGKLGFVFQDYNLLDTLTIGENIELALTIRHIPAEEIGGRVQEMAGKLGILDILGKFPYEVSGGQKQRCACARALINRPALLLADEPTGALDSRSSKLLLRSMHDLNESLGITILMVTHDAFAASHCERILFLKDGRIFHELYKGEKDRRQFFLEILDIMAMLGGDVSDVR